MKKSLLVGTFLLALASDASYGSGETIDSLDLRFYVDQSIGKVRFSCETGNGTSHGYPLEPETPLEIPEKIFSIFLEESDEPGKKYGTIEIRDLKAELFSEDSKLNIYTDRNMGDYTISLAIIPQISQTTSSSSSSSSEASVRKFSFAGTLCLDVDQFEIYPKDGDVNFQLKDIKAIGSRPFVLFYSICETQIGGKVYPSGAWLVNQKGELSKYSLGKILEQNGSLDPEIKKVLENPEEHFPEYHEKWFDANFKSFQYNSKLCSNKMFEGLVSGVFKGPSKLYASFEAYKDEKFRDVSVPDAEVSLKLLTEMVNQLSKTCKTLGMLDGRILPFAANMEVDPKTGDLIQGPLPADFQEQVRQEVEKKLCQIAESASSPTSEE